MKTMAEQIAERVVLEVCELPDYNSPDHQPDTVMCTVQQLNSCVLRAFEQLDYDNEMARGPDAPETSEQLDLVVALKTAFESVIRLVKSHPQLERRDIELMDKLCNELLRINKAARERHSQKLGVYVETRVGDPTSDRPFQRRVADWMMETFSMKICRNTTERNHRYLEESLELVQAMGCTQAEAHMLVDYVFGRPVGEPKSEIGGAMITLAALCTAADVSMVECAERELARCWLNIEHIRAKQAGKPRHSQKQGA